jgi:hypothetical protein
MGSSVFRESSEVVLRSWQARVRVLTNPAAWRGILLCLGISSLLLGILLIFISKSLKGLLVAALIFGGLMFLFVLIGGIIDIFGGFRVHFILTSLGVRSISGKGAKASANAAIIGGILTGSFGAMGAGSLARSEQNVFIPYGEVTKVRISSRRQYILVKGGLQQKPIGLYCNKNTFTDILALIRERCPSAQFAG